MHRKHEPEHLREMKRSLRIMLNRKFILFVALALVLALTFACKKEESANTDTAVATDTSTSSASTAATASDTSGTTSTTASAATTTVSDDDKNFAMKAAEGGMAEVTLGGVAASKATNADVKSFGQR